MKKVVSVSLGSSKRNKISQFNLLGEPVLISREGTDGDMARFAKNMQDLDGQVDAIGVGGADIHVVIGEKRYAFREIEKIVSAIKKTPVVDGSGLKHTLERQTMFYLQEKKIVDFSKQKVFLVSAVDRFGMAQALQELGANCVFGDLMTGLGLPIKVRSYETVKKIGAVLLPIITKLPFQWFYPTGEKQEKRTPKFASTFAESDIICGDWHLMRRFMPDQLTGKTVITQTLRLADFELLKSAGVKQAIATTPMIEGESFATNVMEAALVAVLGKGRTPLTPAEIFDALVKLDWKPSVTSLNP